LIHRPTSRTPVCASASRSVAVATNQHGWPAVPSGGQVTVWRLQLLGNAYLQRALRDSMLGITGFFLCSPVGNWAYMHTYRRLGSRLRAVAHACCAFAMTLRPRSAGTRPAASSRSWSTARACCPCWRPLLSQPVLRRAGGRAPMTSLPLLFAKHLAKP